MTRRTLWKETKEVLLAAKASLLFPKKRKELKDLIRYTRKVIKESAQAA